MSSDRTFGDFDRPLTYYEMLGIKSDASQQEIKATYVKLEPQYLKILRLGLTVFFICCAVYLTFYLAVNMIHFITALPDWLLKLAPVTS